MKRKVKGQLGDNLRADWGGEGGEQRQDVGVPRQDGHTQLNE